jgi:methionyl-tRNA formyltransferase
MRASSSAIAVIGCTKSTEKCLRAILAWGEDEIVGLVTLDPAVAAVKARYIALEPFAAEHGIPFLPVRDMRGPAALTFLTEKNPDILLEVGWSHRIPKPILELPPLGTIGIHNSLLPRNHGAASLNWALIRGERTWGTTLFYLNESIDAGDIIAQRSYPITEQDDIHTLFAKADNASLAMLQNILPKIRAGTAPRIPQHPALVSRLPRRRPEDGKIDWRRDAVEIYNLIRALKTPYPNAFTFLRGTKVFIGDARPATAHSGKSGFFTSVGESIIVGTGRGGITLLRVHCEGEPEVDARTFAKKHALKVGDRFDS